MVIGIAYLVINKMAVPKLYAPFASFVVVNDTNGSAKRDPSKSGYSGSQGVPQGYYLINPHGVSKLPRGVIPWQKLFKD